MTNDLARRIEALERSNRRLRLAGGAALGACALLGLASLARPALCRTVTGERFLLVDRTGTQRMVLDAYETSSPTIAFTDSQGRKAARLELADDGGLALQLYADGRPTDRRVQLAPASRKADPTQ